MRSADGQRASLRVVAGGGEVRHLLLDQPVLQIGRAREACGLVLAGDEVAPHHCCLRRTAAGWWLLDRGTGCCFINSRRCLAPELLRDGDRISIGLHLLEFRSGPALDLADTLARIDAAPIDLSFELPRVTRARPPPARAPLRAAGLAAAAAFTVTLGVAASFSPEPARADPPAPVESDMSPETGTITTHLDGMADAGRADYVSEPGFELPTDALARGRPDAGALVHALQLPPSPDYTIRCPAHAYASSATIAELMRAIADFRNRSGYRGELVVGDLSQSGGGRYGPHRSHQSGRDVDLWLPVRGGRHRRGCAHCGTDLCRPGPDEIDWATAWSLVQALAARGSVQDIFLAWESQPALRRAAVEAGTPDAELARQIQHPVRGRGSLIKHAAGHTRHLHVRFRCPPDDPDCDAAL